MLFTIVNNIRSTWIFDCFYMNKVKNFLRPFTKIITSRQLVACLGTAALIVALYYAINQIPPLRDLPGIKQEYDKKDPWTIFWGVISASIVLSFVVLGCTTWLIPLVQASGKSTEENGHELNLGTRRRLIQGQLDAVEKRLADMLLIPLGVEDAYQHLGDDRKPLKILQRAADVAPAAGWFERAKQWRSFRQGRDEVTFPAQTRMIEVFRHPDVSGRLLILGSPGAGKTTMLLELARELMAEAKADKSKPMPYLFEMAGWREGSLRDYLAADLELKKIISNQEMRRRLLESGQILPLLDGLDELRDLDRIQAGMTAINEFLDDAYGHHEAVVCCRIRDYTLAQEQLTALNGAVELQQLTEPMIQAYLQKLGKGGLWSVIQQNPALLEKDVQDGELVMPPLLKTPLFLSIFAMVNPTEAINGLTDLWDRYIMQRLDTLVSDLSGNGYKPYKVFQEKTETMEEITEAPTQKQTKNYLIFLEGTSIN
jgi:predicted NACHT family NTPase